MKVLVGSVISGSLRPLDCSPPDSSVHGILQARIQEWVAIPFSRGSSLPRDQTQVSCITGRFFTIWATREAHKESWAPKNWCFETMMLEKTLESPLDCKEIKAVNPKGNQPWIFTEMTDVEAPIIWPPDAKSRLIGKDPDARKDWGQEEKGLTEDEIVWWHHWLSGHEFEQTLGDSEGQRSLACYSPWGHKELDMTGQLNNNNNKWFSSLKSVRISQRAC